MSEIEIPDQIYWFCLAESGDRSVGISDREQCIKSDEPIIDFWHTAEDSQEERWKIVEEFRDALRLPFEVAGWDGFKISFDFECKHYNEEEEKYLADHP